MIAISRKLNAAQRAKLVAKRKAAYDSVDPETKNGATGADRFTLLRHVPILSDFR